MIAYAVLRLSHRRLRPASLLARPASLLARPASLPARTGRRHGCAALLCVGALALAACAERSATHSYPESAGPYGRVDPAPVPGQKQEGIFGPRGEVSLFGGGEDEDGAVPGVNAFLWRAALDTLSFLPLASADPFGGVIITDWRAAPEAPDERFKVTAYVQGRRLRADALQVSVFRQQRRDAGADGADWTDAPVAAATARQLEDAILARARQLRVAALDGSP